MTEITQNHISFASFTRISFFYSYNFVLWKSKNKCKVDEFLSTTNTWLNQLHIKILQGFFIWTLYKRAKVRRHLEPKFPRITNFKKLSTCINLWILFECNSPTKTLLSNEDWSTTHFKLCCKNDVISGMNSHGITVKLYDRCLEK